MGTDNVIFLIQIITAIIVCAILLLGGILIFMIYKNKKKIWKMKKIIRRI